MILELDYLGPSFDFHIFTYKIDGENQITRVKSINEGKNYELIIGMGENKISMIIDSRSRMGKNIEQQIYEHIKNN